MATANTSRSTGELASKLQTQAAAKAPANASPAQTIKAYLDKMKGQIAEALPKHMDIDRLSRIALTTIRTNPKLLECSIPSLMAAVMQSAVLGLEPGLIGHCYIIPYGKEATFIIGYKGMIDLARRSGNIQSIAAHEVYENDYIELTYGLEEKLVHVPWFLRKDASPESSGKIVGAYMVAKFNDGGHFIHYMPIAEIEAHRKRSKAANNGPWVTDYTEMCKKTVVRAGWKWLPVSIELTKNISRDETTLQEPTQVNDDMIIDISGSATIQDEDQTKGDPQPPVDQDELEFEESMNAG
jgi:recombination protein RecT